MQSDEGKLGGREEKRKKEKKQGSLRKKKGRGKRGVRLEKARGVVEKF